ncbi:hypothetical protein MKW98_019804 [Papaver atlanticum]|uniref:Uncharacterized protein n=1 Tax=Papaver atlanticum TaxID=357466 RepID=A0AAD4XTM4_9MAGN|nr:hypothetical protein MKW98_019804 [Papaver atlanticum]
MKKGEENGIEETKEILGEGNSDSLDCISEETKGESFVGDEIKRGRGDQRRLRFSVLSVRFNLLIGQQRGGGEGNASSHGTHRPNKKKKRRTPKKVGLLEYANTKNREKVRCHQCFKDDEEYVCCTKCQVKVYCIPCIRSCSMKIGFWYISNGSTKHAIRESSASGIITGMDTSRTVLILDIVLQRLRSSLARILDARSCWVSLFLVRI